MKRQKGKSWRMSHKNPANPIPKRISWLENGASRRRSAETPKFSIKGLASNVVTTEIYHNSFGPTESELSDGDPLIYTNSFGSTKSEESDEIGECDELSCS